MTIILCFFVIYDLFPNTQALICQQCNFLFCCRVVAIIEKLALFYVKRWHIRYSWFILFEKTLNISIKAKGPIIVYVVAYTSLFC